jgi:hypothetical protein
MHDLATTLTLARIEDNVIPILAIAIGGGIPIMAIFFGNIRKIATTKEREQTRREVAAYVAEGSITPQDAERMLTAGREFESSKHS